MATGLGKTMVSVFDVARYMRNHKGRMLFLCHNNDILEQNMYAFQYALDGDYSYGLYNGVEKVGGGWIRCLLLMIQRASESCEPSKIG